ncbi:DUF4395 domain-containing protein [Mucilaginibacter sp. UR6-11]|uniref:DUF4395 domain-containing protein n=1 Tax=Mucilaginibacter sp. UR6-11 TaxID=1435644 RepID=UPI001E2969BF|nr:DUF4395 domain-containing protein [Mucilaginibacter sp. UR6-11]MCC8426521.1 DUF4395 domain-containing protein [Mucilaginibacter sp. UR6-11]
MEDNLNCPIDYITINENRARMVAFFVVLLALTCFFTTTNWIIAAFLLVDFALRVFNLNNYSPLGLISGRLIKLFKVKNKPVDRAPKRFAAFIGLVFSGFITLMLIIGLITAARIILAVLIVFAILESFFGFCAGCHVYSYLKRFKMIK